MGKITDSCARKAYLQSFALATVAQQQAMLEALEAVHLLKQRKLLYEPEEALAAATSVHVAQSEDDLPALLADCDEEQAHRQRVEPNQYSAQLVR